MDSGKTVFVGLSGGVDSSVAALRLKKQGYSVVGVFIKVWHPDWLECNWEAERLDAMRVAAKLDIPFLTCDAKATYKNDVANYFINEYKAGRTPNPDVMCNKYVKFGAFLEFATAKGADYIATGHYAQRLPTQLSDTSLYELHRGLDSNKDQTYFLWTLTQAQLQKTLFPVGNSPKSQIRKEAAAAQLTTARKKDSQGVCFLGYIDIPDFLSHYIELVPGEVKNQSGEVIGKHKGALVYTNGQRHGFTITNQDAARKPLYVIDRDIDANVIIVSAEKPQLLSDTNIDLTDVNYITKPVTTGESLSIQVRYRQTPLSVTVIHSSQNSLTLTLNDTTDTPASGQSCVLYKGMMCLGGGIIA